MRYLLSALVLLLAACGSLPVNTDYAVDYDFSTIDSYVWLEPPAGESPASHIEFASDLSHQRLVDAIDAQLQVRGLQKLDAPRSGSVLVTYHRGFADKARLDSFGGWYQHFGYYPCYHCFGRPGFGYPYAYLDDYWVDQYEEDTLVIDIVDPQTRELLWRGSASRRLPSLDGPEARRAYIGETVQAILQHFPPGVGKP